MTDPTTHTHAFWAYKATTRPPGYLAELAPAELHRDDNTVTHDRNHPAWVAAKAKYAHLRESQPTGLRKLAHGAAGITKAILNREPVSLDVLAERRGICAECEHNVGKLLQRCALCGCALSAKTKLAGERCPAGKWHAVA